MTVVLIFHGWKDKSEVIFITAQGPELLEPAEMLTALRNVPRGVRVQIVNEACYAGVQRSHQKWALRTIHWLKLCRKQEATTRSFTGQYGCSYLGRTFINANSTVTDHCLMGVVREMRRNIPDPVIVTSRHLFTECLLIELFELEAVEERIDELDNCSVCVQGK